MGMSSQTIHKRYTFKNIKNGWGRLMDFSTNIQLKYNYSEQLIQNGRGNVWILKIVLINYYSLFFHNIKVYAFINMSQYEFLEDVLYL